MPKSNITTKTILINSLPVTYELERKNVKNVNLRIKEDGIIHISAGPKISVAFIEAFIQRKGNQILAHLDYLNNLPPTTKIQYIDGDQFLITDTPYTLRTTLDPLAKKELAVLQGFEIHLTTTPNSTYDSRKKTIRTFLSKIYDNILMDSCKRIYPEFHYLKTPFPKISIKGMKTRWGSCNPQIHQINLNRALGRAPLECVDYVVYHEFTHYIHQDHSPAYYKALARHCPNWQDLRKRLNTGNYLPPE